MTDIAYTADIVAVQGNNVLLITRAWPPYKGQLALLGGYVDDTDTDTDSRAACARGVAEETGLTINPAQLYHVGRYDRPGRDPRGRVVSDAYAVVVPTGTTVAAGDDAATAQWVPLPTALGRPMAFDHHRILRDAYAALLAGALT